MFASIDFKNLKDSPSFGYAAKVPFFEKRKALSFKPGLNILFGPNGCGKSTVLNILGKTMVATQGGLSVVTEAAVHETVDMLAALPSPRSGARKPMADKIGLKVAHDGQPVLYCDPRKTVGLQGGSFDDDFFLEGVAEITQNRAKSHGMASANRTNAALGALDGKLLFPKEVVHTLKKEHVNDTWCKALDLVHARMTPSIEKGQPTVLLDEPEANFSLVWQAKLWDFLAQPKVAKNFQVIVATHSPFALGIEGANYIEFQPGYLDTVQGALRKRFG